MRTVFVVACMLVAGCAGSQSPVEPESETDGGPPPATTWITGLETTKLEASVAIDDEGIVTVASIERGPNGTAPRLWQGPRGHVVPAPPGLEGPGDAALKHLDGALYWADLAGPTARIPFQVSVDRGRTWTDPVDASSGSPTADRQFLAVAPGLAAVTWTNDPRGLMVATSTDDGRTWRPRTAAVLAAFKGGAGVAIDGATSRIYVAYGSVAPPSLWVAHSDDLGATWSSTLVALGPVISFPMVAVDGDGRVQVVWATGATDWVGHGGFQPVAPLPQVAWSSDGATWSAPTWSAPTRLVDEGHAGWYPAIATAPDGQTAIVWYDVEIGDASRQGHVMLAEAPGPEGPFTQTPVTPEPVAFGVWCETTTACTSTGIVGEAMDVAIGPDGMPVTAWVQWGEEGPELHHGPVGAA